MARIEPIDVATAPKDVQEIISKLAMPLNIFRTMAHASTCMRPLLKLGSAILSKQELDGRARELAVLHAAKLNGGEYEWIQHVPIAIAAGATQEEIDALEKGDIAAECFDERTQSLLRFTEQVVLQVKADDDTFAALKKHFNNREVVETILAIGFYMTMARLTENCETPLDPPAGTAVIDAIQKR